MERTIRIDRVEVVKDKKEGYNIDGDFFLDGYVGTFSIPFLSKTVAKAVCSHVFGEFAPKGGGSSESEIAGGKVGC